MSRPPQFVLDEASHTALIVVDMQRDFMDEGALPVPGAIQLVPVVDHYVDQFVGHGSPVVLTRDWHPPDHGSFVARGGRWPAHCVAGSPGAGFVAGLHVPPDAIVVSKGARRDHAGYSAFEDGALAGLLRERGVRHLWLCGVATEYCVRATALDALDEGFAVTLLVDAMGAVEPDAGADAVKEITALGATVHAAPDVRPRVTPS